MDAVIANKKNLFIIDNTSPQRGASIMEVLLSIAIVAIMAPFAYTEVQNMASEIKDISVAKSIVQLRGDGLNFVRKNQDKWPDSAQIKLSADELSQISIDASAGFIDKYLVDSVITTDVYLAFDLRGGEIAAAKIAKKIGPDAAAVNQNNIAFGDTWAASAPDFLPGFLVYRITRTINGDDTSKYLHRGTSGEDDFNVMMRNLNMGKKDAYGTGTLSAETGRTTDSSAAFLETKNASATAAHFSNGAIMDGTYANIGTIKISGDISGFKNITAKKLNADGFLASGGIIADRAVITKSVNVGKKLTIKSSSVRTITGFSGAIAHSVALPYLLAKEMIFYNKFGITVSGELMMSYTPPLKIGTWSFPSLTPPGFSVLTLSRARIPDVPKSSAFDKIIKSGWTDIPRKI